MLDGRFGKEKNLLSFAGFELGVVQPLAIIFREVGTNALRKLGARHEDERMWRTFVGGGAEPCLRSVATDTPLNTLAISHTFLTV